MRREVMEAAGLEIYAEIALIIFVVVFIGIFIRAFLMRKDRLDQIAHLPLDDGSEQEVQP